MYYDGVCVAVKVTSGRRFTYRASVASNELLVCVPNRTSRQVLTDFIVKTVQKKREEGVFNDYRDGGFIYLFGEKKIVRAYPT
ncbi:MAG: hypothetical protein IK036_01470, partial [Clostridia bacterium]|nr:hypothetical protein [Clostridia bacterium]